MKAWLLNELKLLRIVHKDTDDVESKICYEGRIREVEFILHCRFKINEKTFHFVRE